MMVDWWDVEVEMLIRYEDQVCAVADAVEFWDVFLDERFPERW